MNDNTSPSDKRFFNDGRFLSGTSGRWLLALPLAFALPFLVAAGFAPREGAPKPAPEVVVPVSPASAVAPAARPGDRHLPVR